MKTSENGVALLKRHEGLELEAYQDIASIWTIGYGHTADVAAGDVLTEEGATSLLSRDLASREDAIARLVTVSLNQNEFDALVSLIYNIGIDAFRGSTARRRLNAGDRIGAAEAMTWWNKATVNGVLREVTGLTRRRVAERALFLTPIERLSFDECGDTGRVTTPGKSATISERTINPTVTDAGGKKWSLFGWMPR